MKKDASVIIGSVLAVIGLFLAMIPFWGSPGLGLVIIGCTINILASKK